MLSTHERRALISVTLIFLVGVISMTFFFTANKTDVSGMVLRGRLDARDNHGWTGELGYRGIYGITFTDCYCITKAGHYRMQQSGFGIEGDTVKYLGQTTPEYCRQACRKYCEEPCAYEYYKLSAQNFKQ